MKEQLPVFPIDDHDVVIGKINRKEANINPTIIPRAVRIHLDEVAETRWVNLMELERMLKDDSVQWSAKTPQLLKTFLYIKLDN